MFTQITQAGRTVDSSITVCSAEGCIERISDGVFSQRGGAGTGISANL